MPKPQQPELRRSGYGSTDRDAAELRAGMDTPEAEGNPGPVPEENLPGHRPPREQDKPAPPRPSDGDE